MTAKSKGPEYSSDREWKVILEDLRSQFRVFGEGMQDVRRQLEDVRFRLDHLETDVSQIKMDVSILKVDVRELKSAFPRFIDQVSDHEHRLTTLEKSR